MRAKPGGSYRSPIAIKCLLYLGCRGLGSKSGEKGQLARWPTDCFVGTVSPHGFARAGDRMRNPSAPFMVRSCSVLPCPLCRGRHSRPDKNHCGARQFAEHRRAVSLCARRGSRRSGFCRDGCPDRAELRKRVELSQFLDMAGGHMGGHTMVWPPVWWGR